MHDHDIVLARPDAPRRLILLFHGVGSSAADLAPVGEALAKARPDAAVVSVEAPYPSGLGQGQEWFSVIGVTEQNRPARVAEALPLFAQAVAHWQQQTGVAASDTVLVGFSQGAIMSLESTQTGSPLAGQVIALAGRLAQPARRAPADLTVHLIHGDADGVVPTRCSVEAREQLQGLGAQVTLDLVPGLGHGIDGRAFQHVLERLGPAV